MPPVKDRARSNRLAADRMARYRARQREQLAEEEARQRTATKAARVTGPAAWLVLRPIPGTGAKPGDRLSDADVRGWLGWHFLVRDGFLRMVTVAEMAAAAPLDRVELVSLQGASGPRLWRVDELPELILDVVIASRGGRMSVDDLLTTAAGRSATIVLTTLLERLEDGGYVDRDPHGDLRATPRGLDARGVRRPGEPAPPPMPCPHCGGMETRGTMENRGGRRRYLEVCGSCRARVGSMPARSA